VKMEFLLSGGDVNICSDRGNRMSVFAWVAGEATASGHVAR
jgi:hypothetical protein